jgi:precorrin-6A/cobalt-precorrin-6A reductase
MKDSGEEGGTLDKIRACEELGIIPIIIGREMEDGFHSLDSIEKIIRRHV